MEGQGGFITITYKGILNLTDIADLQKTNFVDLKKVAISNLVRTYGYRTADTGDHTMVYSAPHKVQYGSGKFTGDFLFRNGILENITLNPIIPGIEELDPLSEEFQETRREYCFSILRGLYGKEPSRTGSRNDRVWLLENVAIWCSAVFEERGKCTQGYINIELKERRRLHEGIIELWDISFRPDISIEEVCSKGQFRMRTDGDDVYLTGGIEHIGKNIFNVQIAFHKNRLKRISLIPIYHNENPDGAFLKKKKKICDTLIKDALNNIKPAVDKEDVLHYHFDWGCITSAKGYMELEYNQPIDITDIAELQGLSLDHLTKDCGYSATTTTEAFPGVIKKRYGSGEFAAHFFFENEILKEVCQ